MRVIGVVFLLATLVLAGCSGGGDGAKEQSTAEPTDTTSATGITTSTPGGTTEPEVRPKFHAHDYWGDRTEVALFNNFPIRIGDDPQKETVYKESLVIMGYRQFDTRMDGDDTGATDKADTVYSGTKELIFKLDWAAGQQIKGLTFYYKPANTARFTAIPDVKAGQEYSIPLGKGWADMAHQTSLSRWKFALEAYDPDTASLPQKIFVAQGEVKVTMRAIKGGDAYLDDPHPYFFLESSEIDGGDIFKQRVDAKNVNSSARQLEVGDRMTGWKVNPPYIVPWDSTLVRVWLYFNYTGPATAVSHTLGLTYSDASSTDLKYPAQKSSGAGYVYYEIPVDQRQSDSPYATSSDWTWGAYPVINGERNYGGDFQGDVHVVIKVQGFSDPASME